METLWSMILVFLLALVLAGSMNCFRMFLRVRRVFKETQTRWLKKPSRRVLLRAAFAGCLLAPFIGFLATWCIPRTRRWETEREGVRGFLEEYANDGYITSSDLVALCTRYSVMYKHNCVFE